MATSWVFGENAGGSIFRMLIGLAAGIQCLHENPLPPRLALGVKPTYLAQHGNEVINQKLPDDDFEDAVKIAQDEFDKNSGATLIEVGNDHRLADQEPLEAMLRACEGWRRC